MDITCVNSSSISECSFCFLWKRWKKRPRAISFSVFSFNTWYSWNRHPNYAVCSELSSWTLVWLVGWLGRGPTSHNTWLTNLPFASLIIWLNIRILARWYGCRIKGLTFLKEILRLDFISVAGWFSCSVESTTSASYLDCQIVIVQWENNVRDVHWVCTYISFWRWLMAVYNHVCM